MPYNYVKVCCIQELRKVLSEGKEEPDGMDYEKNAPIHSLVKRRAANKKQKEEKMNLLVTLLTFGDVYIDQCDGDGHTALHIAVIVSFVSSASFAHRSPICTLILYVYTEN